MNTQTQLNAFEVSTHNRIYSSNNNLRVRDEVAAELIEKQFGKIGNKHYQITTRGCENSEYFFTTKKGTVKISYNEFENLVKEKKDNNFNELLNREIEARRNQIDIENRVTNIVKEYYGIKKGKVVRIHNLFKDLDCRKYTDTLNYTYSDVIDFSKVYVETKAEQDISVAYDKSLQTLINRDIKLFSILN